MKLYFKKKIALAITSGLIGLNFSNNLNAAEFNNSNTVVIENPISINEENKEDKYEDIYENFSKKLGMDKSNLIELLSLKEENNFKLIPISDSKEFLEFWKDLFVRANPDYMKYYASGKLKTDSQAKADFDRRYNRMWNPSSKENIKPFSMAFISIYNGNFAGEIAIGPLRGNKNIIPEIGYVTLKEFSGKHVTYNALKILIEFLKHLNSLKIYNISTLRATAHLKNIASQKILSKSGFTASKRLITAFGKRPTKEYKLSIK